LKRLRHWWLCKTKQTDLSLEEWSFVMALEKTTADIATLNTLAQAIVAGYQSAQAAEQQAQSDLAGADDTVSAQLQTIIGLLQPLVPAPAPAAEGNQSAA
jgi:hypothetical protein